MQLQIDPFHMDMGLHDSDNIILPPKIRKAPASIVPFSQAPSSMYSSQGAQRGRGLNQSSGSLGKRADSLGQRGGSLGRETSFASQVRVQFRVSLLFKGVILMARRALSRAPSSIDLSQRVPAQRSLSLY